MYDVLNIIHYLTFRCLCLSLYINSPFSFPILILWASQVPAQPFTLSIQGTKKNKDDTKQ